MDRFDIATEVLPSSRPGQVNAIKQFRTRQACLATPPKGVGLTLLFAHATGFHKELWEPIIARLPLESSSMEEAPAAAKTQAVVPILSEYPWTAALPTAVPWHIEQIVTFDIWNHGDSAVANQGTLTDDESVFRGSEDCSVLLAQLQITTPLIGVGHSMGGTVLMMLETMRPGTFTTILSIDPAIYFSQRTLGRLAHQASKRRSAWPSWQAASQYFNSNPFYDHWHPEVRDLHVRYGLTTASDGASVQLKCSPTQEALLYACAGPGSRWTIEHLHEVRCPVRFMLAEKSFLCPQPHFVRDVVKACRLVDAVQVKSVGHFIPMEAPLTVTQQVAQFVHQSLSLGPVLAPRPRL
ncbi:hypothetical protein H4R34_001107 [Dimargaris verticillata]|uniref:AB hydrolase-1 domain-containing protein n=1 Tax=Dimargaris verticillata TaxID=2761393 RepID=A0A9W8EE38_9FUNG|nr:hypothetical protein H4R34_001107 [Dimargaris verticillata]